MRRHQRVRIELQVFGRLHDAELAAGLGALEVEPELLRAPHHLAYVDGADAPPDIEHGQNPFEGRSMRRRRTARAIITVASRPRWKPAAPRRRSQPAADLSAAGAQHGVEDEPGQRERDAQRHQLHRHAAARRIDELRQEHHEEQQRLRIHQVVEPGHANHAREAGAIGLRLQACVARAQRLPGEPQQVERTCIAQQVEGGRPGRHQRGDAGGGAQRVNQVGRRDAEAGREAGAGPQRDAVREHESHVGPRREEQRQHRDQEERERREIDHGRALGSMPCYTGWVASWRSTSAAALCASCSRTASASAVIAVSISSTLAVTKDRRSVRASPAPA